MTKKTITPEPAVIKTNKHAKPMCLACHWRKFRRTAIGAHRTNGATDFSPCPECRKSVPFIYLCNCKGGRRS